MIYKLFNLLSNIFPGIYYYFHKIWYQYIAKIDNDNELILMNYGFFSDHLKSNNIHTKYDKKYWTRIQLYDYVVNDVNIQNKDILEIGSGRGGGASYITQYYKPKSMIGIDLAESAVKFCNGYYNIQSLFYLQGDAHSLSFKNEHFDIVLTIEAANLFESKLKFVSEVQRVLRPDGYFLFSDFIHNVRIDSLKHCFETAGFEIQNEEDITHNVIKSLDFDHEFKMHTIRQKSPKLLYGTFQNFAGTKNSYRYRSFYSGELRYLKYVLFKSGK